MSYRELISRYKELAKLSMGMASNARAIADIAESLSKDIAKYASEGGTVDLWSSDFVETDRLKQEALRSINITSGILDRLLSGEVDLKGLGGELIDPYINELFSAGVPVKETIRGMVGKPNIGLNPLSIFKNLRHLQEEKDGKFVRKAVNYRFRKLREMRILEAIRSSQIGWDKKLTKGGFGVGIDERVLEFPLAFQVADFQRSGKILDAGAAMNLPYIRSEIGVPVASLTHFTQSGAKEYCSFQDDRYSYLFGDLRSTVFSDDVFDRILCISTLEHVGLNNSRYGGVDEGSTSGSEQVPDASDSGCDGSHLDAVREMLRILAPGGELLITVPYGEAKNHGWYQVFGREEAAKILGICKVHETVERYFYYEQGWYEGDDIPPPNLSSAGTEVAGLLAIRVKKSMGAR